MFKFDEICELIRLVGASQLGSFELEHGGSRLRIEGAPRVIAVPAPAAGATHAVGTVPVAPQLEGPSPPVAGTSSADDPAAETEDSTHHRVLSPIVGTFYRAPNPDSEPYVKVGDWVEKGQVLCIVEAMKLMNEIESDVAGTVVRVIPQNGQPVEFGAPLFVIRPG